MNALLVCREICKLLMFTILWTIPIVISKLTDNYNYLWLFALSILMTMYLFLHYECLEEKRLRNEKDMD